jgi:hypothetical protein
LPDEDADARFVFSTNNRSLNGGSTEPAGETTSTQKVDSFRTGCGHARREGERIEAQRIAPGSQASSASPRSEATIVCKSVVTTLPRGKRLPDSTLHQEIARPDEKRLACSCISSESLSTSLLNTSRVCRPSAPRLTKRSLT